MVLVPWHGSPRLLLLQLTPCSGHPSRSRRRVTATCAALSDVTCDETTAPVCTSLQYLDPATNLCTVW